MTDPATEYDYVYKIGVSFPAIENADRFPLSELDRVKQFGSCQSISADVYEHDGFIHLSTRDQVPATVGRFFKDHKTVGNQCVVYKSRPMK